MGCPFHAHRDQSNVSTTVGGARRPAPDVHYAPPPAVPGWPLLGILPHLRKDPLGYFLRVAEQFPRAATYRLGTRAVIMVNDPALIEEVLVHQADNFNDKSVYYKMGGELMADGTIPANGETWRVQRHTVGTTLTGETLAKVPRVTADETERVRAQWMRRSLAGERVDATADLMKVAQRVFLRVLYNTDLDDASIDALSNSIGTVLRATEKRLWSLVPVLAETPRERRRVKDAFRTLDAIIVRMILERRHDGPRGDLLDRMMAAVDPDTDQPFTQRRIVQQTRAAFLAGHETTGLAMAWALYLLSRHPAELARAVAEAPSPSTPMTIDAVRRLTHTRNCFEEAMRLYPPVWSVSRAAKAATTIGEFAIPAGATLMLSPWVQHRSPRNWEAPDRFVPDRFGEGRLGRPRFAYFPFIGGPRVCLGQQFALLEGATALSILVRSFRMERADEVGMEPMLSLRPSAPLQMRLHPRTHTPENDRILVEADAA